MLRQLTIIAATVFVTVSILMLILRAASRRGSPIPGDRLNGVAVLGGCCGGLILAHALGVLPIPPSDLFWSVLVGAAIAALCGLAHDLSPLSILARFIGLLLASAVAIGLGVQAHFLPVMGIAFAITMVYLVGGPVAFLLLDRLGGLAAGVAAIAAIGLGAIALLQRAAPSLPVLAAAALGAALGALPFSFSDRASGRTSDRASGRTSGIGSGGTYFLGFTLAALAALLADRSSGLVAFAAPIVALGIPCLAAAVALIYRFQRCADVIDRTGGPFAELVRRWGAPWTIAGVWTAAALLAAIAALAVWLAGRSAVWPAAVLLALAAAGPALAGWKLRLFTPLAATPSDVQARQRVGLMEHRYLRPMLFDAVIVATAYFIALLLRFVDPASDGSSALPQYAVALVNWIAVIVLIHVACAYAFGLYRRVWRYASSHEIVAVLFAGTLATAVNVIVQLIMRAQRPLPIGVVVMGGILAAIGFAAVRYRKRLVSGTLWRLGLEVDTTRQRVLIVGAGEAGQLLAWRLLHQETRHTPVAFVDDDLAKTGMDIHGVRVLGTTDDIPELARRLRVDLIVIAIRTLSRARLNGIYDLCQHTDARIQILPDLPSVLGIDGQIVAPRDVTIDDLLGRASRPVDEDACRQLIAGRRVLVTGAAGSIGSELCRQVSAYAPARLLALDQDETGLFNLKLSLAAAPDSIGPDSIGPDPAAPDSIGPVREPPPLLPVIADVTNWNRMRGLLREHRPEIVFHCAAYKHVPLMEDNPVEAVQTNVLGTLAVARLASEFGAERFILVSTDKAACPVNVMGASKRVAEFLMLALARDAVVDVPDAARIAPLSAGLFAPHPAPPDPVREPPAHTRFAGVRFGNVLGSRGSLVPILERQIAAGGPVTITDARMRRYFMSIPEAVSLVIQAAAYAAGGEIFVLDMGDEIYIQDLVQRLIRLRGLRIGKDVPVVYTGARPGEKLFEVLHCPVHERPLPTRHAAMTCLSNHLDLSTDRLMDDVARLATLARDGDEAALRDHLFRTARLFCPAGCVDYEAPVAPATPIAPAQADCAAPHACAETRPGL